ncbi:MAG: hypothetical protein H6582_08930 [Crocinitomicaceae bacterium]|nr:hypothetical protein [Crocinitomicaceae bacterium]
MIKADQIGELIKQPFNVSREEANELNEVIAKYPYCSTLYIIQLIGLAKANDINFESRLKLAASNVSDRAQLFKLVNEAEESQNEIVVIKEEEKVEVIEEKEVELEDIVEPIDSHKAEEEKQETIPVDQENDRYSAEPEITTEVKEKEIHSNDTYVETEISALDESILSHAVEVAFEHATEDLILGKEEANQFISEEIEEEKIETSVELPEDASFIEWLRHKQNLIDPKTDYSVTFIEKKKEKKKKKKEKKKAKKQAKQEAAKQVNQNKQEESFHESDVKDSIKMTKKEINDLLDKFIREEPSISKPKEFFNPTKHAKKSLEDSSDLVTETLARIHEMQGNYGKAIATYKQLILLYPEKKAFFASRIEKIEEKLDD